MTTPVHTIKAPTVNRNEALMNTAKIMEQIISYDQQYPDLATLLIGPTSEGYISPAFPNIGEFVQSNKFHLPQRLIDKLSGAKCRLFIGLFPEINRAWITIDNKLFLWSLTDDTNIYEYDDQDQIITKVGLVKPKPGLPDIFGRKLDYVLVVTTPLQVILLGIQINQELTMENSDSIGVYSLQMVMPADDVQMKYITGTDDGRIFMIGRNGELYEIEYDHSSNWNRCRMICRTQLFISRFIPSFTPHFLKPESHPPVKSMAIDNERKVLYLLSEKSSIEVVYLGDAYNNYRPVAKHTNIIENAIQLCRQQSRIVTANDFIIESIHVISVAESKRIHLMAMTTKGYRLYFSHYKDAFRMGGFTTNTNYTMTGPPNTLELGHIRVPPSTTDLNKEAGQLPTSYIETYYDCGICVSVNPKDELTDQLHITSVTCLPENMSATTSTSTGTSNMITTGYQNYNKSDYLETDMIINLDDKVQCIVEANANTVGKNYLREITEQLANPPRQFIVLSSLSVTYFTKLRPVDILYQLISNDKTRISHNNGGGSMRMVQADENLKNIISFFERYGKREACAMCLSIICASDELDIVQRATQLFFEYGGAPSAKNATQVRGNHLGQVVGQTDICYSGKHNGFLLYFSRIISSIWKMKLFKNSGNDIQAIAYRSQLQRLLDNTKVNLQRLKHFMDVNAHFHDSASIFDQRFQSTDRNLVALELSEQKSVHDLYLLLVQCIEAISFFQFLLDSEVQNIIAQHLTTSEEESNKIYDLDMNVILTTLEGRESIRELVIATIVKYGSSGSQIGFDVVSRHLETYCNSFFGPFDIAFFKGIEFIRRAYKDDSDYERIESLKESLHHFKAAADEISDQKMESICQVYKEQTFHIGIIELALERAQKIDPQQQGILAFEALTARSTSTIIHDETSEALMYARLNSYQFIFDALTDFIFNPNKKEPAVDNATMYAKQVFETMIRNDDKLFHYKLYEWYLERGLMDELLKVDTPYLIPFFEHYVADKEVALTFLWQYYRLKDQYLEAAEYLDSLASLPNLSVNDRLQYIALALINARCANASELIQALEQKKEMIRSSTATHPTL
ncbi:Nup133 N terminal like-domain-containing protein [Cokeromyces recurvatus]|uniref:Nup133 N terminal like-domain-containing protein n=1 Tax=Cokeromyces recurvatus TaxID=90255 RepID=UPI00221FAB30|nr:Nup133 N terminal like-domain-containing protein [Cokeromyces recurvatus]KAI7897767.1 Nup133 N terminal like-domain-containing protein [Cokeromyces recurvatus]